MMLLGLVGSPVKGGNVDILLTQVLSGASSQGAVIDKIYLNDLKIKPCQSCGVDPSPKYCIIDDDMQQVYDRLVCCDAIVLGTPIYFDTVSAQAKLAIDRCNCLMPYIRSPDGTKGFVRREMKPKKGVLVVVGGREQGYENILPTVEGFFKWVDAKMCELIIYRHDDNDKGGVAKDRAEMDRAFEAGRRISLDPPSG